MSTLDIRNMDCMELMAQFPDKHFDLAIVDPPYGIGASSKKQYHKQALTVYESKKWDSNIPDKIYFDELFRVSKNQIIWGGNYFAHLLPPSPKWIVWDKCQPEGIDQAMFELAWRSIHKGQSKIFRKRNDGNNVSNNPELAKQYIRIHPTQKPVALYKWLLHHYAKLSDKILDTHLGSGSIAIACHDMGFDLTACELDKDYYDSAMKRIKQHQAQLTIFPKEP